MKLFCAEVSDITMQEYKAALHRQQKIEKEEDDSSTEESRTVKRTRRKRVVKKRQPKKEKKVVKKRQPKKKKKKKVVSAVHADTVRSGQEVSSKKTDDDMTIEEIISSLTPLCDEMQVVRRISNESQTITQESSKERADLPTSVGQLSLPIPSYYHSYPISTGSSLADVADVDDEDIWNMWMSCN